MSFDKLVQACNHHLNQDIRTVASPPENSLVSFCCQPRSPPQLLANTDLFSGPTFAFFRRSYKWNDTVL